MNKNNNTKKSSPAGQNKIWLWVVLSVVFAISVSGIVACQQQNNASPASQQQTNASPASALPSEISVADAAAQRDAGAFILDVRQPEEWNQVHIPGSTLIPLGELESRIQEVPKDQDVIVVCRSGNRSATGRDILLDGGFTRVTSMAGGVTQWLSAGYPTVSGP